MKTLATFSGIVEAHNCRAFLEGNGIEAFVRDENMGSSYPAAIGGVRVDVADEDLARAVSLRATAFGTG